VLVLLLFLLIFSVIFPPFLRSALLLLLLLCLLTLLMFLQFALLVRIRLCMVQNPNCLLTSLGDPWVIVPSVDIRNILILVHLLLPCVRQPDCL
jgi:hypothetical protein